TMRRMLALLACASGCFSAPLETPAVTTEQSTPVLVPQNRQNKIDILFLIDDSPSMGAMQDQLKARFQSFLQPFFDAALETPPRYADLHIGVVTSDYGAGPGTPGACDPYGGGTHGFLQATGAAAAGGCPSPSGAPFIQYSFDPSATGNNVTQAALNQTFACM